MPILVYGSLVPDIVFRIPRLPDKGDDVPSSGVRVIPAGGGGNVALALAAWGYEVRAAGNSVGNDPLGAWMQAELSARGISVPEGYVEAAGVTAPNAVLVTPDGERTIIGSDYRQVRWLPVDEWGGVDAVMVDAYSGEAGAAIIRRASERGIPVVGTDRTGPEVADLTVLLWSSMEHPEAGDAAEAAALGPLVAVTAGAGPILVRGPDGAPTEIAPPEYGVRDTTGAGDVFAAATVARLSDGADPLTALGDAADTAARYVSIGRDSAIPPLTRIGS